jgi:hypothetical protein
MIPRIVIDWNVTAPTTSIVTPRAATSGHRLPIPGRRAAGACA